MKNYFQTGDISLTLVPLQSL